jgi:hypothetical protein
MKNLITLTVTLFFYCSLFAQSPQAFNYQGVARDLSGNPLPSQNIGLRFSILQGSSSGTEVYQEVHLVITNSLGLFDIQIGNGTVINGELEEVDWGSDNHFLQVEMDDNGGNNYQLLGTSQLLSVPYALYAEKGGEWSDNPNGNGIHFNDGFVGLGTDEPQSILDIRGENSLIFLQPDSYGHPTVFGRYANGNYPNDILLFMNSTDPVSDGFFRVLHNNGGLDSGRKMGLTVEGDLGIGVIYPKAKLQVSDGDIYIEDVNKGVIMKSPNGECWRMTVTNTGQPNFTQITCPN